MLISLTTQLSVDQNRRSMNVRPIPNLPNEKIGHVRARNDAVLPLRRLDKNAVAAGPRATRQNSRPGDRPIKLALLDQILLQSLIVIGAAEGDLEG
jgi:hypothetical protein